MDLVAEALPAAILSSSTATSNVSRNAVEHWINRRRQWRGIAMRTDKLATDCREALHAAAIYTLLKFRL
ncbi:hypothetical protein ACU686_16720 [Yinghuangia aomiensis]